MQPILKEISVLAIKILHILKHAKDYLQRYLELENLLNIETRFENPLQDMHSISNLESDIPIKLPN